MVRIDQQKQAFAKVNFCWFVYEVFGNLERKTGRGRMRVERKGTE